MEGVTLRPITLSDTDLIVRWRNSDAVRLNMYDQRILTAEQHRDYFHKKIETGEVVQYLIFVGERPIGTAFFKYLDKGVELGLFIGEEKYRGIGLGGQALRFLINRINEESGSKVAELKVKKNNLRAINMYLRQGFVFMRGCKDGAFLHMIKSL